MAEACAFGVPRPPTQQRPLIGSAIEVAQAVVLRWVSLPWRTKGLVTFPSRKESLGQLFPVIEPCQPTEMYLRHSGHLCGACLSLYL